jgi:hypothetical protein
MYAAAEPPVFIRHESRSGHSFGGFVMTLSDLASIGSFISGLAVLISLVFLYFQLRQVSAQVVQAERNQQAAIRQGRAGRMVDINLAGAEASLAVAITEGMQGKEDISSTQFHQFRIWCRAYFYNSEDAFYQHREGLLNEAAFDSLVVSLKSILRNAGLRATWRRLRIVFQKEYVEFVDKLMSEVDVASPGDDFTQWKNDVASEKALAAH